VPALGVIETFEIAEDAGFSLLAGSVTHAVNLLSFKGSEERLDDGIVVTVTRT